MSDEIKPGDPDGTPFCAPGQCPQAYKAIGEEPGLKREFTCCRAVGGGYVVFHRMLCPPGLKAQVAKLKRERDDYHDDFRTVIDEQCAPDEKHCSCVPHLRKRIAELARQIAGVRGKLKFIDSYADMAEGDCSPDEHMIWQAATILRALLPAPPKGGDDDE